MQDLALQAALHLVRRVSIKLAIQTALLVPLVSIPDLVLQVVPIVCQASFQGQVPQAAPLSALRVNT